eukprot:12761706-Alexandrium_andersonii.AAC.1
MGSRRPSTTATWRQGRSKSHSHAGNSGSSGSRRVESSRPVAPARWPRHRSLRLLGSGWRAPPPIAAPVAGMRRG